ncbi:terminase [Erysipelotrichaceae bacterium MTC7]|nr:terminase [Erysipelotrichaceae bacterium MTC7]
MIRQGAKIELAKREFFSFCNLLAPDFYKEDREYLVTLCNTLQEFYEGDDDVIIINMPPRHGKSRTASNFVEWLFGINRQLKVMTGSYNETLSTTFSKAVRNTISERKADPNIPVYSDVFPGTKIKWGDGAMNLWSLEGGFNSYLATSPGGTATGFGANYLIIDDLIKNAKEANNARILEEQWEWFVNTMLSRTEAGYKIIIIMTRWHTKDLAGRVLDWCKEEHKKYKHINMPAFDEDGNMLCDEVLPKHEYLDKVATMGEDIASANYQQKPIDIKGKLYTSFKTYERIPVDSTGQPLFTSIRSYTDTADEGSDYLCTIIWGIYEHYSYVLDVIYTQLPMEETEPMVAAALDSNKVMTARFESNNGGKGYARQVASILEDDLRNYTCDVSWFHQSSNKVARILTAAPYIMRNVLFPVDWKSRWPDYYEAMNTYQRKGKNEHDDAPDATSGIKETNELLD